MLLSWAMLCGLSRPALAVVTPPASVTDRLHVVGVIAEAEADKGQGIAVLKDRSSGRSFAISTGESLPGEGNFKVKAVRRKTVLVSDGQSELVLSWAPPEPPAKNEEEDSLGAEYWERIYREIASASRADQLPSGKASSETSSVGTRVPVAAGDEVEDSEEPAGEMDQVNWIDFNSDGTISVTH
jgi:hypothetical protein